MPEASSAPRLIPEWQRVTGAIANLAARSAIIASIFLLPFFVFPVSFVLVDQAKVLLLAVLTLIALIAWVVARMCEGNLVIPKNVLFASATLLPVAYVASALVSGSGVASFVSGSAEQDTVVGVCMFYVLLVLTAFTISRKESAISRMLQAFTLGSCILLVFQIARIFWPGLLALGGALPGSMSTLVGSVHDFSIVLGLVVFLAIAFRGTPLQRGYWKWLIGAAGTVAYLMLFFVNETDVWYALAGVVLIYGAYRFFLAMMHGLSLRPAASSISWWIASFFVIVVSLLMNPFLYARLPASMQLVQSEVRPSWQGTFAIGEKVLSGKSGFIFGSGPNTFAQEWGRFKPSSINTTQYWNVNFDRGVGLLPTAFVTLGALGIIAWLLLVCGLLWSAWRFMSDRNSLAPPGRAYTGAALFSSLYLMTFLVMYVPGTAVVALTFIFLGFLAALEMARDRHHVAVFSFGFTTSGVVYAVLFLSIAALLSLASVTALRAAISNMLLGAAASAVSSGDTARAEALVKNAIGVFPGNDSAERAAVQLGLTRLSALVAAGGTDEAAKTELQTTLAATIQHGLAAISVNSGDYQNWLSLASLYQQMAGVGVEGASDNAKHAYERAIAENPTNPLLYTQLAQLLMRQNDLQGALQSLDTALALKKDFPAAYFFRSQVEASQRNFTAATADAAAATNLASSDPQGWYNLGSIYYQAGEYESAIAPLSHAISLQNNYADAMYLLALTYGKLGRMSDGLPYLQEVNALNPNTAAVTAALKAFENGASASSTPAKR